jgi:hypothetical protein
MPHYFFRDLSHMKDPGIELRSRAEDEPFELAMAWHLPCIWVCVFSVKFFHNC